jgi:hypothetical protein
MKGDRSAVYAHLIPGSVKVKVGVRAGAGEEFRRLGRSRGVPAASVRFRRERAEPEARSQGPGGTFFNLFVPHTVPHGHFGGVLSALQDNKNPAFAGLS